MDEGDENDASQEASAESILEWAMRPENAEALRIANETAAERTLGPGYALADWLGKTYDSPLMTTLQGIERIEAPWRAIREALDSPALAVIHGLTASIEKQSAFLSPFDSSTWYTVKALNGVNSSLSDWLGAESRIGSLLQPLGHSGLLAGYPMPHWASALAVPPKASALMSVSEALMLRLREDELAPYRTISGLAAAMSSKSLQLSPVYQLLNDLDASAASPFADAVEEALAQSPDAPSQDEQQLLVAERQRVVVSDERLQRLMDAIVLDPRLRYEIHWRDFERIVAEILEAEGYEDVMIGPGSKDGGIDVVATLRLPFGRLVVAAQCKRFKEGHSVAPNDVRALWGVVTSDSYGQGIFVTTSTFQPAAVEYAARQQGRLALDDGEEFVSRLRRLRG